MEILPTDLQWTNKKTHTPQAHILTLSSNNLNPKNKKLVLTLTQIIIYEIWQARNNLKYDNTQLTQKTIINKIITQIQAILNTHYNHHKEQDILDQFDASFCINRAIATLNGNKLQINIWKASYREYCSPIERRNYGN